MTAMPWGQKKRTREMIQSQMVTPPLAAMEGTTLRLKTATTKRRTRSRRPRARMRWGWAGWAVVDKGLVVGRRPSVVGSEVVTTDDRGPTTFSARLQLALSPCVLAALSPNL